MKRTNEVCRVKTSPAVDLLDVVDAAEGRWFGEKCLNGKEMQTDGAALELRQHMQVTPRHYIASY